MKVKKLKYSSFFFYKLAIMYFRRAAAALTFVALTIIFP